MATRADRERLMRGNDSIEAALFVLGGMDLVDAVFPLAPSRRRCSWCEQGIHVLKHPHVTGTDGYPPNPAATVNRRHA